jgi:8-oxo-dGTP pyrophosphatase MutT (NUDIX family)
MATDVRHEQPILEQVAALPYRFDARGDVEVLLITSRRGGQHWIPPKGNLIDGLAPHEAAAREAFEEAGVLGSISAQALGDYQAVKWRTHGASRRVSVTLFPMQVESRASDWPEKEQRSVLWFETRSAAKVVREQELARLIEEFDPRRSIGAP